MSSPKILLSGKKDITNHESYVNAIKQIGAIAIADYLPKFDNEFDGLVLCGGGDVAPKYYHEEVDGSSNIDVDRDEAEFSLLKSFIEAGKPVFGICRGHQLINVFFGGSLYQDISEAEIHTGFKAHSITTVPNSVLSDLYGYEFSVNSAHHQAVKKLGKGLRTTALGQGKYVEAIEHISLPIIGVQWHPERMCFDKKREDTVDGAKIIEHFVNMCRAGKNP